MELDTKQKVLLALYTEYQKDLPNMGNIKASTVGIDTERFYVAVKKLENEGYVTNIKSIYGDDDVLDIYTANAMLTKDGIEYIEKKLGVENTDTSEAKVRIILEKTAGGGFEHLKDLAAKTLVEIIEL